MATKDKYALLGDSPVLEAGRKDHLNFENTAVVLAGAAVETRNPLTIGIFGEWGTGKTSLMRLIEKNVEGDSKSKAVAVWFNAWQYEKEEHLIVPLIATISKCLDEAIEGEKKWSDRVRKGAKSLGDSLRAIAYGFSVKGKIGIPLISEAEVNLSPKGMIERYQDLTKDSLLKRSLYFDAFEQLKDLADESKNKGKSGDEDRGAPPRVVVFVDDLDRCFPDKAVELLEGIKLVLHQPGFSFVLGVNDAIISAFIKTKYQKDYRIDPGLFEDYLDKIVQVKVPVPKRKSDEMSGFIENLLKEGQVFSEDLIKDMVPLVAEAGKRNPRSIVRLLNRIIIASRIGELEHEDRAEEKNVDPLALLLHLATDEERYDKLCRALSVVVIVQEQKMMIGEYLAKALEDYGDDHNRWIADLRGKSRDLESPSLEKAINVFEENGHLCQLLKSSIGQKWLKDKDFREMQEVASDITLGDEEEKRTVAHSKKPIRELLERMVRIVGGEFQMGSEDNKEEKPVHNVKLKSYYLGAT